MSDEHPRPLPRPFYLGAYLPPQIRLPFTNLALSRHVLGKQRQNNLILITGCVYLVDHYVLCLFKVSFTYHECPHDSRAWLCARESCYGNARGGKNFSSFQEYLRKCVVTFFCDIITELVAVCIFKIRTYLQHMLFLFLKWFILVILLIKQDWAEIFILTCKF